MCHGVWEAACRKQPPGSSARPGRVKAGPCDARHWPLSLTRADTHTPEERAEIEAIFSLYDDDGSGRIDVAGADALMLQVLF